MSKIDLLAIQPTTVSKDLTSKIVTVYGNPKTGKTTLASQFPKSLLIAFEVGYNGLAGVMAQNVTKWSEFKQVLKELVKPEVQQTFSTIIIDTADIAYDLCEKFILSREGVDKIGDIPYGGGYAMVKKEFADALRSIPMLGYGLVNISHAHNATFTAPDGTEYQKTTSTLGKTPRQIVFSMSDIIGYSEPVFSEDGTTTQVVMHLRDNPRYEAGSRFKYVPETIPFSYEALTETLANAIEQEEKRSGIAAVEKGENRYEEVVKLDFNQLKIDIQQTCGQLVGKIGQETASSKLTEATEKYLGTGKTLKDVNEKQVEQLSLILSDLQDLLK